jgi:twitching motility protein PilT
VRLHGNLVDLPLPPLAPIRARELLLDCVPDARRPALDTDGATDFALDAGRAGRFRANVFRHFRGFGGTFRVIADEPWSFERLGLPAVVRRFVDFSHGLVLITGPMGSGKSTTLAALLQIINRAQPVHIVTIEDPIEILLASDRAQISQRQVRTHTPSFADALRSTLREDPDVIAVGELRDPESVATAISAAETGHLVFGTLHTAGAHRTILRLLDQFPPSKRAHIRSMLATSLRAVVCQQLVPNVDGRGRSLASEILVVNSAVSNLIREDRVWQIPMVMQTGAAEGMRLMDDALLELVRDKRIGLADALARCTDRDRFMGR